ncbi:MAG: dienelactone hydrolase family protein [Brachybacterium sp.]|nr:dienelactone hydrolase family protein [Brachybacterium sp.]
MSTDWMPSSGPQVCRIAPPGEPAAIDETAVRFSREPRAGDRIVLLLHGLGSHEDDLLALTDHLPEEFVYASLRGVFEYGGGWAWLSFPIDVGDHELLDESAAAVEQWIAATEQRTGARVVGSVGFSQGGILTLQLLRRDAQTLDWAVQLSGVPFPAPMDGDDALAGASVPVLWGYGGMDPFFPPEVIGQVRDWMGAHTDLTEVFSEQLGHGVDETVLQAVQRFVGERAGTPER